MKHIVALTSVPNVNATTSDSIRVLHMFLKDKQKQE